MVRRGTEVVLVADEQEWSLPVVAEQYVAYRDVLAALGPASTRAVFDRLALLHALEASDVPTPIALGIGADEIVVADPHGRPLHRLAAVCGGRSLRLGFGPRVLAAALRAGVGPDALLELTAPDQPVIVRSADQGTLTTLAMPTLLDAPAH